MTSLYKYTSLEYIESCVENGVYASTLSGINDPYEGRNIRYQERYRVVCMTNSPRKMLMWAYYVNHKGCCIEYDVTDIVGIQKVKYVKEFISREDMSTEEVIKSLYKKGNEWKHENEYRIVYHEGSSDEKLWKHVGEKIFLIAPVKSVLFGCAAELDENYYKALEFVYEYNTKNKPSINVSKCILRNNSYQLIKDNQFDLEAEIQSMRKKKS